METIFVKDKKVIRDLRVVVIKCVDGFYYIYLNNKLVGEEVSKESAIAAANEYLKKYPAAPLPVVKKKH